MSKFSERDIKVNDMYSRRGRANDNKHLNLTKFLKMSKNHDYQTEKVPKCRKNSS